MTFLPRSTPAVVTGVALLMVLTTTGGAVAGSLITGAQIKDGTVTSADIKNKTIATKDIAPSARGVSPWGTIPSGTTVSGEFAWDASTTGSQDSDALVVSLPATAPVALTNATVNFAPDNLLATIEDDPTCTGTIAAPTAPPGKVCIYIIGTNNTANLAASVLVLANKSFLIGWNPATNGVGQDLYLTAVWAYTAP